MYHPEAAHYDGDPRHELAVAEDDAYRRSLAEQFDSGAVDAIMHGELMDARGRVISSLGDAFMTGAYSGGAEIVTEFESVNAIDIVEADEAREAEEHRGGGTYDGIRDAMRRPVDLSHGSSKNPKRRTNPDAMMRPSNNQLHQRLMGPGRPRKGLELREQVSARVNPDTRNAFMDNGVSLGETLDMVATLIHRGLTPSQIRDVLQTAAERAIIGATGRTAISSDNIKQLPRCS